MTAISWAHPASSPAAFGIHIYDHQPAAHHWRWLDLVANPNNKRVLIIAPRDSAKTTWIANAVLPWRIGNNPLATHFIGSVGDTQAKERLQAVKLLIEANEQWRAVFPHVEPDYRRGWSQDGLHVRDIRFSYAEWMQRVARYGNVNTPTLVAGGAGSSIVVGKRFSGTVLFDDLHDEKNAHTLLQRDRVWSWVMQTVIPTMTEEAQAIAIGTRWNRDDVPGRLKLNPAWVFDETSAILDDGSSYWPSYWSLRRLLARKAEIGTAYFRAQYLNDPTGLAGNVFDSAWFKPLPDVLPKFRKVLIGVDLAIKEKEDADFTVIVTAALDDENNLYLLDVVWGHWSMNTTLRNLKRIARDVKARFERLDLIAIEDVQFQAAVTQEMLRTTTLPAKGITPDKDKTARARYWAIRAEQGKVYADRDAAWWPIFADDLVDCPNGVWDRIDAVSILWQGASRASKWEFTV